MTKLMEWLCGLTLYLAFWLALVFRQTDEFSFDKWSVFIYLFPVFTLFLFGIYSLAVVLWRVYCFNDCPEAAKELQEQIVEAREDLKSKGLKF